MSVPLLRLDRLRMRHPAAAAGRWALDEVSLSIAAGERVAVIGASGSGKTSLLLAMALVLRPHAGRLTMFDVAPWEQSRRRLGDIRRRVFLAPQAPPLPPRQRVATAVLAARLPQLGLAASLRMLVAPSRAELGQAHAALTRLDLGPHLFDRVDRLSGGERQRVGLARALVAQADLLLIDEPLSALDPARAAQAIAALLEAAERSGAALVATLHQVPVALGHFSRIIGLDQGRLVFDAAPSQIDASVLRRLYARAEQPAEPAAAVAVPTQPAPRAFR